MFRGVTIVVFAVACTIPANSSQAVLSSVPFIHADAVHAQGITGSGVIVAVLDSGLNYEHLDPSEVALGGCSFDLAGRQIWDRGISLGDPHGTLVSLLISAHYGVAPHSQVLPIRIADETGRTSYRALEAAIRYVADRKKAVPSLRVINMSYGPPDSYSYPCDWDGETLSRLTAQLWDATWAGIVSFAATGNDSYCDGVRVPACISYAIPVVAVYDDWYGLIEEPCPDIGVPSHVTCFSNMSDGCSDFLGAPGYDISYAQYQHYYGTSFASAEAAGVAALMLSKNGCSNLDAWAERKIMSDTAESCPVGAGCDFAAKKVNALAAVNATPGPNCPLPGDLTCDGRIGPDDLRLILDCLKGLVVLPTFGVCACANFPLKERDDIVDMRDFAQFQLAFTGYGSGACCHPPPYPQCTIESVDVCTAEFGATYQGHGTTCENVECPSPNWGACCYIVELNCSEDAVESCVWRDGMYMGDGSTCAALTCPTGRYHNVIDPPTNYTPCGDGLQLADDIVLAGDGHAALTYYDLAVYGGGGGDCDVTVELYTNCPQYGGTLIPGTERTFIDNHDSGSPAMLSTVFDSRYISPISCGWWRHSRTPRPAGSGPSGPRSAVPRNTSVPTTAAIRRGSATIGGARSRSASRLVGC